MKIYLISCGKRKLEQPSPAKDLYRGELYKRSMELAELRSDRWFILSAKYGLLKPETVIDPYDETLTGTSKVRKIEWAKTVVDSLTKEFAIRPAEPKKIDITLLAGNDYRIELMRPLIVISRSIQIPLRGLGIGQQIQALKQMIDTAKEQQI